MLHRLKMSLVGLILFGSFSAQAMSRTEATALLFKGVESSNLLQIKEALKAGASIKDECDYDYCGQRGLTVLHRACTSDIKIMKFLIDQGASVNALCDGATPLHILLIGYAELATGYLPEILQAKGSISLAKQKIFNPREEVKKQAYEFHNATLEIIKLLLKNKADCFTIKLKGKTAFEIAELMQAKAILNIMNTYKKA